MLRDLDLTQAAEPLLRWYLENARTLPWREEPTPYRVWISEIMLQQTRVEAVKPYFARFVERLPDAAALAECPEDELLKLWEGLGYYNRARNLQEAARQITAQYGGALPADYAKLLELKGIGHYTAGAVASIAYGIAVPAVDGNVLRVLTRLTEDDTDIAKQSFRNETETVLREGMERLVGRLRDKNVPGALNQALMELGATVCVPNGAPLCGECPWREICLARRHDTVSELPVKSRAKARKIERRTVLIIRDGDKVAIRKRPARGLLAGLYELPNVEGNLDDGEVLAAVKDMGFLPLRIQRLAEAKHIFSHIEWHMQGYAVLVEEGLPQDEKLLLVDAEDAGRRYAIPAAFAAYAEYMNIRLGNNRFAGKDTSEGAGEADAGEEPAGLS